MTFVYDFHSYLFVTEIFVIFYNLKMVSIFILIYKRNDHSTLFFFIPHYFWASQIASQLLLLEVLEILTELGLWEPYSGDFF